MNAASRLKTRIVKKIEEITQEEWESVYPKTLENYYFFKTLDESSFDQFSFSYILVYENNTLVGCTSCFIMDFHLDIAVSGLLKLFFRSVKKAFPGIINPKVVICGVPMGLGRIGMTGDSGEVVEAICGSLNKIAEEHKAAMIFFKDFTKVYEDRLKPLLSRGFSRIESFPYTEMNITFNSFDDYLKTLSRASREGVKRNLKKTDAGKKIDLEVKDKLADEELLQVHGLYLQTYNKQEMGLEKLPLDFFKSISRNMPKETRYFLWRIDGKLAAFALCLVSGDYFIDYYLGFDYALMDRYHLYFVRFRDLMKWCIAHGMKKYEMGVTSYESKRRLGFDFIRLYFYIKHRNKFINYLVAPLSRLMKPESFDPVFKQMNKDGVQ
ncbi:MAG: GNAT family N-acetyltransferase [Candidatus Omnitrophota bacterium]|nr:GNAT family N-acetyltransferase [Candidatus Omnitrophota bacterium]